MAKIIAKEVFSSFLSLFYRPFTTWKFRKIRWKSDEKQTIMLDDLNQNTFLAIYIIT
jgi:hypothetical protein